MKKQIIAYVTLLYASIAIGQKITVEKDTSFSIQSTYIKEKKKFPFIEIASPTTDSLKTTFDIGYKKLKHRKLSLDIFESNYTKNNIGIILIHGGGWRSGDKTHMHNLSKALAKLGYTCFAIEYRLSLEAKYPAGIIDIDDGIQWVKKNKNKYKIHTEKLVVLGTSSGGQMASLIGAKNNSNLLAIVNIDGLLAFHHPDAQEGLMAAQWLDGDYNENPKNWIQASALTHISSKSAPFLFISSSIKRFSAGRENAILMLKNNHIKYDYLSFEKSPHTFWYFHPWFDKTVFKIDTFLKELVQSTN